MPEVLAAGSQRIEARVALPLIDAWSTFEAETAEIELPDLAEPMPAMSRTATEPMPADELASTLAAAKDTMDNAKTLPGRPARFITPDVAADPRVPVTSVLFGEQQILIVHRLDTVELILPGGQRLTAPRDGAGALAEALVRDVAPR